MVTKETDACNLFLHISSRWCGAVRQADGALLYFLLPGSLDLLQCSQHRLAGLFEQRLLLVLAPRLQNVIGDCVVVSSLRSPNANGDLGEFGSGVGPVLDTGLGTLQAVVTAMAPFPPAYLDYTHVFLEFVMNDDETKGPLWILQADFGVQLRPRLGNPWTGNIHGSGRLEKGVLGAPGHLGSLLADALGFEIGLVEGEADFALQGLHSHMAGRVKGLPVWRGIAQTHNDEVRVEGADIGHSGGRRHRRTCYRSSTARGKDRGRKLVLVAEQEAKLTTCTAASSTALDEPAHGGVHDVRGRGGGPPRRSDSSTLKPSALKSLSLR